MAITTTSRGTNSQNSSSTTHTISPSGNLAYRSWAVLVVAVDNSRGGGSAHTTFTATDTKGNTWTRRCSPLYDPGAASAGVEGAVFTTPMDAGLLTTGDTITVTVGTAATAWASALVEVVPTSGYHLVYSAAGDGTGGASNPTVTTGTVASGAMVLGAAFWEHGTNAMTDDSDTSNGTWGAGQTVGNGVGSASGMSCGNQRKITTGSGTQTFNPTLTGDSIASYLVIEEAANTLQDPICGLVPVPRD